MKTHITFLLLVSISPLIVAQNFQTASECNAKLSQVDKAASDADSRWSDCVAGTNNGKKYNCQGMNSPQRIATSKSLAATRDNLISQKNQIEAICRQLTAKEQAKKHEEALARSEAERQSQQQKSSEQANSARRNEAWSTVDRYQRDEAIRQEQLRAENQKRAAREAENNANRRATAVGSAIGGLMELAEKLNSRSKERSESISESESKYDETVRMAETTNIPLRAVQPSAVNKIQKDSWKKLNDLNRGTLQQVEELERGMSNFSTSGSTLTQPTNPNSSNPFRTNSGGQGIK